LILGMTSRILCSIWSWPKARPAKSQPSRKPRQFTTPQLAGKVLLPNGKPCSEAELTLDAAGPAGH